MVPRVRFKILYGFGENFINFLIDNGIVLNDIESIDFGYIAVCNAEDYKFIAKHSKKFQCRTKIIEKYGIYFKLKKYTARKGILAGIVIFYLLTFIFSKIIWVININTTDDGIKSRVAKKLFESNIYPGVVYNWEYMDKLKYELMHDSKDISYLAFNFYKGVLECQIYSVKNKENYTDIQSSENIYSSLSGIVTDVRVYRGFSQVQPGQSVTAGDMLVSNVITTKYEFTDTSDTAAYIEGICKKEYSIFIPYNKTVNLLTGEKHASKTVYLPGKTIKLKEFTPTGEFSKRTEIENLSMAGFVFPLTVKTDTYYLAEKINIVQDMLSAQAKGRTALNTLIANDVKLKKEIGKEYQYKIHRDGVEIICITEGYYEMT